MPDDKVVDLREDQQYQENINIPQAVETMYYLSLCQGYSGEMED